MNRIAGRAGITILIALLLVAGMGFFLTEFVIESDTWVISPGSPHIYNGNNIGTGAIVDRNGVVLLDLNDGRCYNEDPVLRKATVHWLGDRDGFISAPAIANYSAQMAGYDMLGGLYHYGNDSGVATLSLSAEAQKAALEAMGDYKGTVAVYNFETGEILCSVTTPTFDPDNVPNIENDTAGSYEGVYLNRFIQSAYIPGSIYKIVTLAAALETIPDIQDQTFYCSGSYPIEGDEITCETSHGTQTLQAAFRNSCNCAFAQICLQIGPEKMEFYTQQFGVTQCVTFDGVNSAMGNYEAVGAAMASVAWSGIGQYNDQVNPCAFLTFMGAIAGGGSGAQPYLVSKVQSGKNVTYTADQSENAKIMSADTAETVSEYLRLNVTEKYGEGNFLGMTVCAKTGTGEVGGEMKPNAMLAGFVSDDDCPLAFIVFVENGGYGAQVCIPIASAVLSACKDSLN